MNYKSQLACRIKIFPALFTVPLAIKILFNFDTDKEQLLDGLLNSSFSFDEAEERSVRLKALVQKGKTPPRSFKVSKLHY